MASIRDRAAVGAVCVPLLIAGACARRRDAALRTDSVPPPAAAAEGAREWTIGAGEFGPIRAGMTLAAAGRALGTPFAPPDSGACAYVHPPGAPPGVSLMVVHDTIVRVDVDSAGVRTAEGAAIGDDEARIHALYAGRVRMQPHKYTPSGHYLVVTPAGGDTTRRLVFESDGRRVVQYHAGRLPEVLWVEGCS